jgi:hypothetical protein
MLESAANVASRWESCGEAASRSKGGAWTRVEERVGEGGFAIHISINSIFRIENCVTHIPHEHPVSAFHLAHR